MLKKVLMAILLLVLSFATAGCGRRNHVGICLRYGETDASSYLETNLNLEDNVAIRATWKRFEHIQHKRRRSYIKKL